MYYRVLKIYSDLEDIIEKHAKKISEAKISLKNYLKTSNELFLRRFLALVDSLRVDREVILNRAKEVSKVSLDKIGKDDLKNTLEIFDYIHALLDYHRLVDLDEERKMFAALIKRSEGTLLSRYRDVFERDLSSIEENINMLDELLESIESIISNGLKMVSDRTFIENYLKNLSFRLEKHA